ncbi:ParB N-terminal domain-containing protein [Providencia sp. 2.29]|uniref:ParB N-terminal domain-containing protein n=1 Tax=Providencia sp. 2.29 TaxID=2791982 RepID=UPI0018CA33C6|nr:ParB N-terminal domain-containing protein [Providencia sp. 2.29]QPN39129.1 ParB N-terminal domain-containing protein [Providencia sp. 2.29]
MSERKTIKVNKLLLDINNPRFPDSADNQRDAISKMLEIQSEKIINLAKDIASKGLDPTENILVLKNDETPNFYTVMEGNRRITALKLLLEPELSPNDRFKKIFEKIRLTVKTDIVNIENCVVFDDDSYNHWVNIKHTGQNNGVGRVEWTAPEKARYLNRNGKLSFGYQILESIQINFDEKTKDKCKKHLKITNISRLFDDPQVRNIMNIEVIDGYLYCKQPHSRFIEQLRRIIDSMIEEDDSGKALFTVNRIRSKADRSDFIIDVGISNSSYLQPKPWRIMDEANKDNAHEKTENNTDNPKSGKESSALTPSSFEPIVTQSDNSNSNPTDNPNEADSNLDDKDFKITRPPKSNRNNLIPSNVKFNFGSHKKCSRIFNELKRNLSFDEAPISISIMLRIFIDLSVTIFCEENKLSSEFKKDNKGTREPGLHDKVVLCASYLQKNKQLTGYEATAVKAASSQITKASGSLQQYVHNPSFLPTKEVVNTEWDNFQRLLEEIWK